MIKQSIIFLSVFLCLIFLFSCEKKKESTGQLTIGVSWLNLNCGSGTAKVYFDNNFVGTITNLVDTVSQCNQENCLTILIGAGKHTYKVNFKENCAIRNGELNILAESCNKLYVKF